MSDAEIDALDGLVAQIAAANEQGVGEGPDRDFHLAIAKGTGNGAIVNVVASLWAFRQTSPECALMLARARSGGSKPVVEEHSRIVAALRTRDPARARAAMRAHLNAVLQHLLETTEADAMKRVRAEVATIHNRFGRSAEV